MSHTVELPHTDHDRQLDADGASTAPCCPKCEAPGLGEREEWCLRCGYYPRMGFFVEVDPQEYEQAAAPRSPWDPRQVPLWAWILVAGLATVTAVSIGARLTLPLGTWPRAMWAIGQCVIGLTIFACIHLMAYLSAIADDGQMTVMDLVLRPMKTWGATIHGLPRTARRVCLGAWSITAAVMGPTVVGGIPYHLLWEMGPQEQAGANLVHAITDAARRVEAEDKPLGEAIQDFAGHNKGEIEAQEPFDKFAPENLPERKFKLDCLVIGYKPDGLGGFSSLVLAAAIDNKLQVVGTVSNEFVPPAVRQEMFERLSHLQCAEPFVPTTIEAVWVKPQLTCRVGHNGFGASKRIAQPVFQKQLGDVKIKP